jgi:hypothetical protein
MTYSKLNGSVLQSTIAISLTLNKYCLTYSLKQIITMTEPQGVFCMTTSKKKRRFCQFHTLETPINFS